MKRTKPPTRPRPDHFEPTPPTKEAPREPEEYDDEVERETDEDFEPLHRYGWGDD